GGGRWLFAEGRLATPDGKARCTALVPVGAGDSTPADPARDGRTAASGPAPRFRVSTRRGNQFNSMVQRDIDPLTGARRDDVLISAEDLERLQLAEGAAVLLRSSGGTFRGRLKRAPILPGNLEVHWPEGNALLAGGRLRA